MASHKLSTARGATARLGYIAGRHCAIGWLCLLLSVTLALTSARGAEVLPVELVPYEVGELWGYRSADGSVLIEPTFHIATPFGPEGSAAVAMDEGWAIIDRAGNVLVRPFIVDNWPDVHRDGLARFVEDGRIGFFDRAGRKVVPATFDAAHPYSEELAAVCVGCVEATQGEHIFWTGGRWGYVDLSGELVIPMRYEAARPFEHGRAEVRENGRWIQIGRDGEPVRADMVCRFETETIRVRAHLGRYW